MANYDIHFSCGHTESRALFGPTKERTRKIEWFGRSGVCTACYRADLEASRASAAVVATETNQIAGLPPLTGSAKQIAWAETIRAEALASNGNRLLVLKAATQEMADKMGISLEDFSARAAELADIMAIARGELETCTDARWWIDHKNTLGSYVRRAYDAANTRLIADVEARRAAEKAAKEAAEKADRQAIQAQEIADRQAEHTCAVVKAKTFLTGDRDHSVVVRGHDLIIQGRDGRTAYGFIDGGEWAVCKIGDHELSSTHPEMERIAHEARRIYEQAL